MEKGVEQQGDQAEKEYIAIYVRKIKFQGKSVATS